MENNFDYDEVYNTLSQRPDIRWIFRILLDMNEEERRKPAKYLTWYFQGKVKVYTDQEKNEICYDMDTGLVSICIVGHEDLDAVIRGFEGIEKRGWLEDPFK